MVIFTGMFCEDPHYNECMAVLKQKSRARSVARSIAASLKVEGQILTREQIGIITEVIDGKRDAEREIHEFTSALAGRVQLGR